MGCSQTKIMCYTRSTKTEKVQRSKKRQQFMKDAVLAVNKFAAAHSSYANCLVKTGSALTDFAAQFPTTFMEPFIEEEGEEDGEEENMPQLQTKEEVSRHVKGKLSIVEVKESVSVVEDLGDHFVKASKAAEEVSRLLEGTGLDCHSKFTDIDMRGHVPDETFAMILNKLLAWENKFCQELKNAESKKLEFQRKFTELNKLFERGTKGEAVEKLKVVVNHLHTGCTLYEQSLESIVSDINKCDQQLYPRLVHLVYKMATMWKIMETHHEQQSKIAMLLRHVDSFQSPVEATRHKHNHDKTRKLLVVLREWLSQFDILMNNQKKCIMALNNQLEMRDEISESLPIQVLLQAWHCRLEKLPQQYVRTTIANFAAEIDSILQEQEKEMVLKRKCEVTKNEYAEKISRQLTEWEKKYEEKEKKRLEVLGPNMVDHPHELVREIQLMKIKLVAAKEDYSRQCLHVTQKSLSSLQTHLPKLFKAMSDFSLKSSMMYNELADL